MLRIYQLLVIFTIFYKINGNIIQSVESVDPVNIDLLRDRYLSLEKALWAVIRSGVDPSFVLQRIHETHKSFFKENFNERGVDLPLDFNEQRQLAQAFSHIDGTVQNIQTRYEGKILEEKWLIEFAERGQYITMSMDRIYNVTNAHDFFGYIKKKGELQNCGMQENNQIKSVNQMLFDHYNDISVNQLKAFALTQLSYMILTEYRKKNFVIEALALREQFIERSNYTRKRVIDLMKDSNRDLYNCDPDVFQLGVNYDQVTRVLQGYIDNEVNLNPIKDCKRTCADHNLVKHYNCEPGTYCSEKETSSTCSGDVVDCHFVKPDMTICPSPKDSYRRYEAIEYDQGVYYGSQNIDHCEQGAQRAESWYSWFVHCSHCFCFCDERGPKSDRYFSLRPVLSRTNENMIITGVSLRKINRIFMWVITEGQLVQNGDVNQTSIHPKTGHLYKLTDPGIEEGIDYHMISWQNRTVLLDTIVVPEGKVITGVRFRSINGHLSIEVKASPFDFDTGRLVDFGEFDWISADAEAQRTEISLENRDLPTKFESESIPDMTSNRYVKFSASSISWDVAQTTIPFIDTQMVFPPNPVPLSGIGLYYKSHERSGGFIAPKVVTYDFRSYLLGELNKI